MRNIKRLFSLTIAAFAAAFASTTAFAVRYWKGGQEGALFSDPSNWFSNNTGSTATSKPDTTKGETYWFNDGSTVFDMTNANANRTVFGGAEAVADKVYVGTGSDLAFVWSATAPSFGLANGGKEFRIGYNKTPSYLQIDSGTYSFGTVIIGCSADTTAGLTLNGGTFTSSGTTRIGYATPATARLTVNGGEFVTGKVRVGGGQSGVDGTLTITNGLFKTTSKDTSDVFMMCDQANTTGTMIIDGGTLDTTSCGYIQMGGVNDTTSTVLMKGGTWNTQAFVVGGKARTSVNTADTAVARLIVDGGTINASSQPYIGSTAGNGTLSEMIVSNGTVNVEGNYLYIGGVASGSLAMEGGELNVKGFLVGGKVTGGGAADAVDGMVSRLVVNGGTINASANCCIGSVTGTGTLSEMIVSNGTVNINADNLYVGERGPGSLVMEGGELNIKDTDSYGLSFGHSNDGGTAVGTVTLNGGTLTARKFRFNYTQPGSRVIFNGGTLKATRGTTGYIDATGNATNLTCEVQAGGLVFDTAGFDVTIAHDLVGSGPLIKKGAGKLTLSGTTPFNAGNIYVCAGEVVAGGTTYGVNTTNVVAGAEGGNLGAFAQQSPEMSAWLTDPDFLVTTGTYGGDGKTVLDQPRTVMVSVDEKFKLYDNLGIGITTNDTLNGVAYSFSTTNLPPRTLKVVSTANGVAVNNVRDFGGWPLLGGNGARTRFGVIFRGGNLDNFAGATSEQKAASVLAGLKSEIDLRPADEVGSGYPDTTTDSNAPKSYAAVAADYVSCPTTSSSISSGDSGRLTNAVHRVFSTLGTQGMLPSYFHCRIGRDRTGMMGLLLLGLMGVEEEVLYRDYLLSNFANLGDTCSRDTPKTFLTYILDGSCRNGEYVYNGKDAQYGVSVASRCRQYLEMCGVTTEEINNITMALSGETADEVLARVNAYEAANDVCTIIYESYEGSGETNAIHRLPAGEYILPTTNPARSMYTFAGWDTDNAVTNENGTVTIYAKWLLNGYIRFWADEGSAPITSATSWNPELDERGLLAGDKLGINQGIWKVVSVSEGESTVDSIYVGWGTENGSDMNKSYDHGGRLDITGGTLNVTNCFYVGGSYSDRSNNVVNVTGGKLVAGILRTANCNCNGGKKSDTLNISGGGIVEVGFVDNTHLARSDVGLGYVNVTNGGTFISHRQMDVAYKGEAHILVDDGTVIVDGAVNVGRNKDGSAGKGYLDIMSGTWTSGTLNVGNGGDGPCYGEANVYGGTLDVTNVWVGVTKGTGLFLLDGGTVNTLSASTVGNEAACTGTLHIVSGTFNAAGDNFRIGRNGRGVLTMDGGTLNGVKDLKLGTSGTAGYGEVNLNGGTINAGKITTSTPVQQTINWNGGTFSCDGSAGTAVFFPANTCITLNVLKGGAVYATAEGRESESDEIAQPMSGVGAFVKRGGGTLLLTGALDLTGGFSVEGGTLSVSSLSRTYFKELSVADGGEFKLNGAEVTVMSYKKAGVSQPGGTYNECGGIINVLSAEELVPATALWTDAEGDGDVTKPENWIVRNGNGLELIDVLPGAATAVLVPAGGTRPDMSGTTVGSVTLVASGAASVAIPEYAAPAVVANAIAWYDPDDIGLLTLDGNGGVVGLKNKGTAGASLDLVAYNAENVPKRTTSSTMPGREPLEFLDGTTLGFKTTNSFNAVASGFTLFVVEKRATGLDIYGIELDNAEGTSRLGGIAQVQARANCTVNMIASEGGTAEEYRFTGTGNESTHAYVWGMGADGSTARAFSARLYNGSMEYKKGSEPSYYSFANVGTEQYIYYGMRRATETGSAGLLGEAMVFASRLSTEDREIIRDYLYNKWLFSYDLPNLPANILVEAGTSVDFGGGQLTFATVKGSGTIVHANIVVTGTVEPGLSVDGTVTFAQGAAFDMTTLADATFADPVVLLTAAGFENAPDQVMVGGKKVAISPRVNQDGTVSLVGTLAKANGRKAIIR